MSELLLKTGKRVEVRSGDKKVDIAVHEPVKMPRITVVHSAMAGLTVGEAKVLIELLSKEIAEIENSDE